MTDDFVKQQARSAAEDIFKAWLVAVQETSWSEKRAFIECVSAGIISAYERVGTLTVEIGELQFELNVAKEREEIDNTESRLANERIADLEASLDVCSSELRSWVESPGSTPTLADFSILDTVEKVLKRNPTHAEWGVHDPNRSESTKDKISMKYRLLIAGSDDLHYFDSEIEALREANKINRWWLGRRAVDPENEPLCCATVWEPGQLPGDWPESLPEKGTNTDEDQQ
jgi:hypothetical protein